jgi:uncharacterized protein YggT (Ycf19 family)
MAFLTTIIWIIVLFIDFVFGVAILGLVFRLFLRAFAIGSGSTFTNFIYNMTQPMIGPFNGILPNIPFGAGTIELTTILAIIVYILAAFLITELLSGMRRSMQD